MVRRYVQPSQQDGGWEVIKQGHCRPTAHARTRQQAISRARALTVYDGGGEVLVKDRMGKVFDAVVVPAHTHSA